MSTPFAPSIARAADDGVRYTRAPYTDVMQSIRAISKVIVEGGADKDVVGVAADILIEAGIDGRSGHTIRDKAQAILSFVTSDNPIRIVFAPDPVKKEFVVSAAGLLCLRPGLCIRKGDCDDMDGLLGALLQALGIVGVFIVLQTFERDRQGKERQEHVLLGVKDELGRIFLMDAQFKNAKLDYINPKTARVVRQRLYDPHEVLMKATGHQAPAEIVTLGALPTVPLEDVPFFDRVTRSYWQRHDGALWRHETGAGWHRVEAPDAVHAHTGVGYVDDAGHARELRHDGQRYWEKRNGRWYVEDASAAKRWRHVGLPPSMASELERVIANDNKNASTAGRGGVLSSSASASEPARVGVGERVEPNLGDDVAQKSKAEAAQTEIGQAVRELSNATIDLRSAVDSYIKTRADLSLPTFEAGPSVVAGPGTFPRDANGVLVWSPAITEYASWILKLADHLVDLGQSALEGQRLVSFTTIGELAIQALGSDALRYVLSGVPGARLIAFQNAQDATQWTMDENGNRSTSTPGSPTGVGEPITIATVVIVIVVVVAVYFIVKAICDAVTTSINEKANNTLAQAVANGTMTPEQYQAYLKADAERRAAIAKAETDKNKSDPFASTVQAGATVVKYVVVGAGVVAGLYLLSLAVPSIKAWRSGATKTAVADDELAHAPRLLPAPKKEGRTTYAGGTSESEGRRFKESDTLYKESRERGMSRPAARRVVQGYLANDRTGEQGASNPAYRRWVASRYDYLKDV